MKIIEYGKEHGEVILLLHGGGLSWWNYRSEAELLCSHYHVILPILDGHADSDSDFISIEENAGRILSFIDREYGGSVFLIGGLSLGAQIVVEILLADNSFVKRSFAEKIPQVEILLQKMIEVRSTNIYPIHVSIQIK